MSPKDASNFTQLKIPRLNHAFELSVHEESLLKMKILLEVMKCRAVFVCVYLCVCVCQEALCVFVVEGCKSLKIFSVFTTLMLVYVEGTEQGFGEMTQSTEV